MTKEERTEIVSIEAKVGDMLNILSRYLAARILSTNEREALDWVRIRIELVCRTIFHDPTHTAYKLTPVERLFFLQEGEKYLMRGSYPLSCIEKGELCKVGSDSFVLNIIDYLASIQRKCLLAETTGILPKEESLEVEY